ncbi:hypothetical protein [Nocardioides campestrisoli]|uniref:hypothetical protein n=1 Tax=Nocardioides campestrisoli TaxID=2736757 RepID=UPI0015E6EE10|nr:hypothetical protein [Nocardioides campestrisoli]
MGRVLGVSLGLLMVVAGGLWTFQSFGWLGTMAEGDVRATLGPALAGLGVALVYVAVRGQR